MNDHSDDFPIGVLVPAARTSMGRALMMIGGSVGLVVLIALGIFTWVTLVPSKVGVEVFNRKYGTGLSSRDIYFKENGFVDSEFYASVPMTQQEFVDTTKMIRMQNSPRSSQQLAGNGPWWFKEPQNEVFILVRIGDETHRDYIDGHYDSERARGYFHYFDH